MKLKRITTAAAAFAMATMIVAGISAQSAVNPAREIATERSEDVAFRVAQLVTGLDHPWSLAFLPDGSALVTERPGRLLHVTGVSGSRQAGAAARQVRDVRGLPDISDNGQGGLLDIVVDANFQRNRRVYFTYSSRYQFGDGTTLARARLDLAEGDGPRLVEVEELFRMSNSSFGGRHFGSRLAFGSDGTLYMTIGDRGDRDRAQDLGDHAGTVLRFNRDGSVPADNPFVGRSDALPEIYSYGHRNAQGMALNPDTGEIWLHEHGPRGGDEINIVRPALNYGWPVVSYGGEYATGRQVGEGTSKPGMEEPLLHWTPSIAPSGMTFYTGTVFDAWQGDIFVGALAGEHLRRGVMNGSEVVSQEVLLQDVVGRIRDVRTGPDGLIYLITDEDNGGLYRLEPAP